MSFPALRDFLDACDAYAAAPTRERPLARLIVARMNLTDAGLPASANWIGLLRALVALATAAQEASGREERRDALAEIMKLALAEWRGDLGDTVIAPPKAPPAKPVSYKDD